MAKSGFMAATGLSAPAIAAFVVAVAVALGVGIYEYRRGGDETAAPQPREEQPQQGAPAERGESAVPPLAPSFDVFRVEPDGSVVAAGRAAPGATVDLMVDGEVFDTARANDSGEWALAPGRPLPAGDHDVRLRAGGATDEATMSAGALSVVVDGANTPLVALAEPGRPARIMQQPEAETSSAVPSGREGASAPADGAGSERPAAMQPEAPAATRSEEGGAAQAPSGAPSTSQTGVGGDGTKPQAPAPLPEEARTGEGEKPATPAAAGAPAVTVAGVEVEGDRSLFVQGEGPAGGVVRVYLNDEPLGDARVGADGTYTLMTQRALEPGRYEVRADLLGDDGSVAARAEVKFDRVRLAEAGESAGRSAASGGERQTGPAGIGEAATADAARSDLEIERGDNLWRIARRIYGRGIRYSVIYEANRSQIRDPDLIYPGQVFTIPVIEDEKTD